MADHVFDKSLIVKLSEAVIPQNGLVLAVDRKLHKIYDNDDATKVFTKDGKILEISKDLKEFDAVDTGLFACTPFLFNKIEEAAKSRSSGDCSLSDGVKALCKEGLAVVCDIGEGNWQDVDTPGAVAHAEKYF
jgi:choline kinase